MEKNQLNHKFTLLDNSGHTDFTTFVNVANVYVNAIYKHKANLRHS